MKKYKTRHENYKQKLLAKHENFFEKILIKFEGLCLVKMNLVKTVL